MENLIPIGYWRKHEHEQSDLPWPAEGRLPEETKRLVGEYLLRGRMLVLHKGYARCRLCGEINGNAEYTDGEFVWPVGYAHYIVDHNIMPAPRLLAKVLAAHAESKRNGAL